MDDRQSQTSSPQFFILGAQGAAAEVARHLLAAGKSVTLSDADSLVSADLAACPLFRTYDIGYRRDIILFQQLERLGGPGTIDYLDTTDLKDLNEYNIVIYSNSSQFSAVQVQAYCRQREIPFILVQTLGLCGRVFIDRGSTFCYFQPGAKTLSLKSDQHHTLSEFAQLPHAERTAATEVISDQPGANVDSLQHIFKLIDSGFIDPARYKTPWNAKAALDLFTQFGLSSPTAFQNDNYQRVAAIFAGCAHFQFYPVNLVVGALGALEALRVFDCKFGYAHRQQVIVDYTNVLPSLPLESEAKSRGTRYDGLIALFGIGTANKLLNQKVAVVASTQVAEEIGMAVALYGSCSRSPLYLHELMDATARTKFSTVQELISRCNPSSQVERVSGEQLQAKLVPGTFVFIEKTDGEVEALPRKDVRVIQIQVPARDSVHREIDTAIVCGKALFQFTQLALQSTPTRK